MQCDNSYHQTFKEGQICRFCGAKRMSGLSLVSTMEPQYLVFLITGDPDGNTVFHLEELFQKIEDAILFTSYTIETMCKNENFYTIGSREQYEKDHPYCYYGLFNGFLIEPIFAKHIDLLL